MRGDELLVEAAVNVATSVNSPDTRTSAPIAGAELSAAVALWLRNQSQTWIFAYSDHLGASGDEAASEEYADDMCADALRVAACVLQGHSVGAAALA